MKCLISSQEVQTEYSSASIFSWFTILLIVGALYIYPNLWKFIAKYEWKARPIAEWDGFEFEKNLNTFLKDFEFRYIGDQIPLQRALFFTNGTDLAKIDENFPIIYQAELDKGEMSFQEYGFLVSTVEIVIKQKESKTSKDNNQLLQYFLPFYELCAVKKSDTSLSVYYMDGITESIKNLKEADLEALHQIIKFAIDSGYTKVNLFDELVSEEEIQLDESLEIIEEEAISEMELDDYKNLVRLRFTDENRQSRLDKTIDNQIKSMDIKSINRAASTAAGVNLVDGLRQEITNNQMFDRFGGGQGHGHVGEQAGTVLDRFLDKRAVALGSSHTKNGADRLVNGVNIQTKYSRTPGKTIGQAFTNEGARYLNPNGSMMVIEVPRDQYNQGVKLMGQKIKEGKVPNETNPANAKRYVKKGALTYEQAQIATHSIFERKSTITTTDGSTRTVSFTEKMIYSAGGDFLTGASIAIPTSIVTSVWVFCTNRWQGVDEKLAVKNALKSGIRPMLMAGTVYMFSSQFAGVQINNLAKRQVISAAEKVQIKNEIAQRHFGRGMTVLMVATAVGPDVIDVLRGRISVQQLAKNAVVTGSGITAGAAIGVLWVALFRL